MTAIIRVRDDARAISRGLQADSNLDETYVAGAVAAYDIVIGKLDGLLQALADEEADEAGYP